MPEIRRIVLHDDGFTRFAYCREDLPGIGFRVNHPREFAGDKEHG